MIKYHNFPNINPYVIKKNISCIFSKTVEMAVINTILSWINYMYIKLLRVINGSQVKKNSSSSKEKFINVKCDIDCVEFKIAVPSSLAFHKLVNSDYKSHNTIEGQRHHIWILNREMWESREFIYLITRLIVNRYCTVNGIIL